MFCSPGNAGIAADAPFFDGAGDPAAIAAAGFDLVVVGPEAPLVEGFVDALAGTGVAAFGPVAAAARLEGSKAFAKEIMFAAGVPTAEYSLVTSVEGGLSSITSYPAVIKADGLAAGKGVVIAADEPEARLALEDMLVTQRFGDVPVVVEEYLMGVELSLLALCDGESALPLAPARDFKRIGEGDAGPNTGGMGAYSPVEEVDAALVEDDPRQGAPARGRGAREPRHAVPRRPLRRPDAHRRRLQGARVQRPLRRSRDAGRAPAPEERRARPVRALHAQRRPGGRRRWSGTSAAP